MPDTLNFEFRFSRLRKELRGDRDRPMRILFIGDFSGHSHRDLCEGGLAERLTPEVDVDNIDAIMERLTPSLHLNVDGSAESALSLEFHRLDDFHPDTLYQNLALFQSLRKTRERLLNPATFAEAAAELDPETRQIPPQKTAQENNAATLQRLLGKKPADLSEPERVQRGALEAFIREIVKPYIESATDPEHFIASLDRTIGEQMRALLHHPDFQALEAVWRGLNWLVTGLETDQTLKLHLLDATKQELAADMEAAGNALDQSELYKLLVEKKLLTAGGESWSLLVSDYRFGPEPEDIRLLGALGAIASQAGGPFLAEADSRLLGCHRLAETPDPADWKTLNAEAEQHWRILRTSLMARWLGLALPRILLRLPYGVRSDPIESFEFEELSSPHEHAAYLWGNPAFACAFLIAKGFQKRGWNMQPGDCLELDGLPAYTYHKEDEARMQPCAEVCFSESVASAILDHGIMPLMSYRNRDAVRLARFQSLADPPAALSGPWE